MEFVLKLLDNVCFSIKRTPLPKLNRKIEILNKKMSKTEQGLPIKNQALLVFPLKEKPFNNKKVKKVKKSQK